MTAPLLVVVVDGGDDRVLSDLMGAGRLPALADFRRRGAEVGIDTVGHVLEGCVWPSLLSGRPIGDHALAHVVEFEPETMGLRVRREADVEPFWLHLPDRGQGALVVDPPEMHPHPASRADESCSWYVVDPPHGPFFTSATLERTLRPLRKPLVLRDPPERPLPFEEEQRMSRALAESIAFRLRTLCGIADGRVAACLAVHETHVVTHWLGHHVDPEHRYRPERRDPGLVARPYERLDAALAPLLGQASGGNAVLVFARGIRPAGHAGHLLEGLLERAGWLVRRGAGLGPPGPRGERSWLTESARRLVPERARERLARRVLPAPVQHRLAARGFRDRYVWGATRLFPVPSWHSGLVRLNLAGREAAGIVGPEEAPGLLEEATRLILETQDAETGLPLAESVIRAQEAFPGARTHLLPDLLVAWGSRGAPTRARHPRLGEWHADPVHHRRTEHNARGTVLMAGPNVRHIREPVRQDWLGLAPTLLCMKGVRRPSVMSGSPWSDVLAG